MKKRNTQSKKEIMDVLESADTALSHDMINDALKSDIDRATIYRVLNSFCEDGKVHKIVGDDGKQYFAMCPNCGQRKQIHSHNHIHFRCLNCGKVECLHNDVSVPLPDGYVAKVHNLVISGFCKDCS